MVSLFFFIHQLVSAVYLRWFFLSFNLFPYFLIEIMEVRTTIFGSLV